MVYVDHIHMVADSLIELHSFAKSIGIKKCWFEKARTHPHYDVLGERRTIAIKAGAVVIDSKTLLQKSKNLIKKK